MKGFIIVAALIATVVVAPVVVNAGNDNENGNGYGHSVKTSSTYEKKVVDTSSLWANGTSAVFEQGQSQGTLAGMSQEGTRHSGPQFQVLSGGNSQTQGGIIGAVIFDKHRCGCVSVEGAIAGGLNTQSEHFKLIGFQNGNGKQEQFAGQYQDQGQSGSASAYNGLTIKTVDTHSVYVRVTTTRPAPRH